MKTKTIELPVPVISKSLADEIKETIAVEGGADGSFNPDVVYDSIISGEGDFTDTDEYLSCHGYISPVRSLVMKCLILGYEVEEDEN